MDYDTLDNTQDNNIPKEKSYDRDDFSSMTIDLFKKINFKVALFIFIIGIFIFSNTFIDLVIRPIPGTVNGYDETSKGTIIQLLFLSMAYIVLDLSVQGGIL